MTRIGIVCFCLTVLSGPLYTVGGYSAISNTVSQLGAQHTVHNYIMIAGFIILGGALAFDGVKHYATTLLPFILFGGFMGLAGLFPHKPLDPAVSFNTTIHSTHATLAAAAGVAITAGFIWQGVLSLATRQKLICFYLAIVCVVFPILMLQYPIYQGIIQRLMYLQVFIWLWIYYPSKIRKGQ